MFDTFVDVARMAALDREGLEQLVAWAGTASASAMDRELLKQWAGWVGTGLSFVFYGLSLPVLLSICQYGSTRSYSFYPYLGQLANCFSWVAYALHRGVAQYIENFVSNFTGMLLSSTALGIFMWYGTGRWKITLAMGFLIILALVSIVAEGINWWGSVTLLCNCLMFVAPLRLVGQVWQSRSVESMPLSVAGAGMIGAVPWFVYGILLQDPVCWAPNCLGILVSTLQLLLYLITVYVRGAEPVLHSAEVPVANANYVLVPLRFRATTWAGPSTELPEASRARPQAATMP